MPVNGIEKNRYSGEMYIAAGTMGFFQVIIGAGILPSYRVHGDREMSHL